ncbi:hypothetical protein, partial [Microvirga tunisiensis]|uniref:hypothetical protein n=1 Tax=Microvirga tunisiensis TaxID=2108360 RepID=UPI001AEF1CAC
MGINPLADPAPLRSAVTRDGRPTGQNHCVEDLGAARECGFPGALSATRLPAEQLREFYTLWSRSERVVTAYSQ